MTLNPIPLCKECGEETRRLGSYNGKGRYCCVNRDCSNRRWYIRGSRKKSEGEEVTKHE